jgi:shikimate kinase
MYITLIGYMGSGKTTIGHIISLYLRNKFYDLDEIIFNWKNQNIHNLFVKNGENNFRSIETDVLHFLKSIKKNIVISTGGGTPCFSNNFYFLKRSFLTFYLHLSSKEIFQRIRYQKYNRPLISSLTLDKLLSFIHRHISSRIKYYEKFNSKLEIMSRLNEEIIFSIHNQLSLISYKDEYIKPFK